MKAPSAYHRHKIHSRERSWDPGYFDLVMATGIVSTAAFILGYTGVAQGLFIFNIIAFVIVCARLAGKILFSFYQIKDDFRHHTRGPAYFTLIASINIIGSQFYLLAGMNQVAVILGVFGLVFWLLITYAFFTTMTITSDNPGINKGINGTWLVAVVATQSIPVLGARLVDTMQDALSEVFIFSSLVFFCIGCMLYIILITLIFYRLTFLPLKPSELKAPYWISMGAAAITTLAGSSLLPHLKSGSFSSFIPFIEGFTLFFWSVASWWIPLLFILGFWRHILNKVPLPWTYRGYEPSYWSMVFPLGMYTVCTYDMAEALQLPFLTEVSRYFIFLAFGGWTIVFIGMCHKFYRKYFIKNTQSQ